MNTTSPALSWRPRTTALLIIGLVAVLIALVVSFAYDTFKPTTRVYIGGSGVFDLRVASTPSAREKGLSGVEGLDANGGLLMAFKVDGDYRIWMKDMVIPIDVVWLDKDKKVIYMGKSLDPKLGTEASYAAKEPKTRYILELPAGSITANSIKPGDVATFELTSEVR